MTEREKKTTWQRLDYKKNPYKYISSATRYREKHPYVRHPKKLRTHCKMGHELTVENVYEYFSERDGKVIECKECVTNKNHRRALNLRASHLLRKFGITLEDYDKMFASQGGKCFVCGASESGGKRSFYIDHDHKTGKIRKLLCLHCNSALGYAKDDPIILDELAAYLRKFTATSNNEGESDEEVHTQGVAWGCGFALERG